MHVTDVSGKEKENGAGKKNEKRIAKMFSKLIKVSNRRTKNLSKHQVR